DDVVLAPSGGGQNNIIGPEKGQGLSWVMSRAAPVEAEVAIAA
ncbi:MAG: hypothetical protein QOE54_5037, partial [Streptosporangiaceae bacterium]|nr:hypothetical protein [Streptosporangiaceae bacterium]